MKYKEIDMFKWVVLICLLIIIDSFGDDYLIKKIKDGGVVRSISIPKYRDIKRVGIIVKFNSNKVDLDRFQSTYQVEFVERLSIGYYIFNNNSSLSDIDLVGEILENEKDIETIKPNQRVVPKIL